MKNNEGNKKMKSFNLISQPWIKVLTDDGIEKEISLTELFVNAKQYRQLSGELKSQNLAILRLFLAILTRVYSNVDDSEEQLLDKWTTLYEQKSFTDDIQKYLNKYQDKFDFFGKYPFYQVTREVYDQNVDVKKQVKNGKGTVSLKQLNRSISESNNTPAIFSPKSESQKDTMSVAELVRWVITYQNYTGVTDKTKILSKEKFSVSQGWLYGLNSFYVQGKNLFETLMLNLVLNDTEHQQIPVWEYDIQDYLNERIKAKRPDNISGLYTLWSRVLHIEWKDNMPTIFTAGLPKVSSDNAFDLEPMTIWKENKKDHVLRPAIKSKSNLDVAMWRNFGEYLRISSSSSKINRAPGLIEWIKKLDKNNLINSNNDLDLISVGLISDGNATSQAPYAEYYDDMRLKINVIFDNNSKLADNWTTNIEGTIELTQLIGKDVWIYANKIADLMGITDSSYASKQTNNFYDTLNLPFYDWLASLTAQDNKNKKIWEWKNRLNQLTAQEAKRIISFVSSQAITGKQDSKSNKRTNVFTAYNDFHYNVIKHLGLQRRRRRR